MPSTDEYLRGRHEAGSRAADSRIFATDITIRRLDAGSRAQFEPMNLAMALHRVRPVIFRVFPFAETPQAHELREARGQLGEIDIAE